MNNGFFGKMRALVSGRSGNMYAFGVVAIFVVCALLVVFFAVKVRKLNRTVNLPPPAEGISSETELASGPSPEAVRTAQLATPPDGAVVPARQMVPAATRGAPDVSNAMVVADSGDGYSSATLPPRRVGEMLEEMAASKRKPSGVPMTDKELNMKVYSPSLDKVDRPIKLGKPSLGPAAQAQEQGPAGNVPAVTASVSVVRIASDSDYVGFTRKHKGKALPRPDFSSKMIIALLAKEDNMPSRIFEIDDVKADDKTVFVKYRVNPLAAGKAETDSYAHAVVKKSSKKIVLEQVF